MSLCLKSCIERRLAFQKIMKMMLFKVTYQKKIDFSSRTDYVIDVLWGQPIKLIQVVSTSEPHEY